MKPFFISLMTLSLITTSFTEIPEESTYQVQRGDTLWHIAQDHDVSVRTLKTINELNTDLIFPDQEIQVEDETIHEVVKGDTLYQIAKANDLTVEDLKQFNQLTSDLILVGETLTLIERERHVEKTRNVVNEQKEEHVDSETSSEEPAAEVVASSQEWTMTATAYTAECDGCNGITATGIDLNQDRSKKVVAVDPNVIPLGSRVYVEGYGEAIAGDVGGAIKGHKIDIHVPTTEEALAWGVRQVTVELLE
ncbi:3D (Asp-Asp-Asp) domain-containing protein [Pelagirhabdus alkalitolerans]|uniref:3D (Asp-Asp-Asp) domain-containing protein n=2 Tax=Pelagirhabdus alkalitolerans TaxID=1612202 RepID=A0A1G6GJJ3_9BACI|nr:3D (Asp-Asp-Asp) domain-containing protein [Pelagirhabdus alkalitolerans]